MPNTPFVWKAALGGAPDGAFSAQLGNVTYYAVTRSYGHAAYVEMRGARGGQAHFVVANHQEPGHIRATLDAWAHGDPVSQAPVEGGASSTAYLTGASHLNKRANALWHAPTSQMPYLRAGS